MKWGVPNIGWVKCNTDGASKGNPSRISYGFCIRDRQCDLLYAEAKNVGVATNMIITEATTIWKALRLCKLQGF